MGTARPATSPATESAPSGGTAQPTNILKKAGFDRVANLAGGMLHWRAQRLAVEGTHD